MFMQLNRFQQRVSDRHLLEVDKSDLKEIFEEWGLVASTMQFEKYHPLPRGRKSKEERIAETKRCEYEYIINGFIAYNNVDKHAKTTSTLHKKRPTSIESEYCKIDFM